MSTTGYFTNQYFTTALNVGGGIDASQTAGIIISDVSGLDTTKPGIALINYSDPLNTTICEWITFTSVNGSKELVGVTRGAEGFSAKTHDNGVAVVFPLSESHINNLVTALSIGGVATNLVEGVIETAGDVSATKIITSDYVGKITSTTSSATPTPTGDRKVNELYITALAAAAEFQAPSGTPANGNKLVVRVKDDGTARALTYNTIYSGISETLPATTVLSKVLYMEFVYNSTTTKWEMIDKAQEGAGAATNVIGYAERTSSQTGITTLTDLTGLAVTVDVPSGARIRITGHVQAYQGSTAGSISMSIYEGATLMNERTAQLTTAVLGCSLHTEVIKSPTAGSHTYKLAARPATGSGAVIIDAGATTPSFILVEVI